MNGWVTRSSTRLPSKKIERPSNSDPLYCSPVSIAFPHFDRGAEHALRRVRSSINQSVEFSRPALRWASLARMGGAGGAGGACGAGGAVVEASAAMGFRTFSEPFRIHAVEPLRMTTEDELRRAIEAPGYNLFSLR